MASFNDRRAQYQIFGRISDQGELRQDDEICPAGGGSIASAPDALEVAVDIADGRIQLCECDGERQKWILRWALECDAEPAR
jgi:hypothetical protein